MTWNDVKVGQFMKMAALKDKLFEEPDEFTYETIAILNNITLDDVLNMPINDVRKKAEDMVFLNKKPEVSKVKDYYMLNGKKYCVFKDINDITTAQYIDFQTYAKNIEKHLDCFLSIFLIPEGKKYNDGYRIIDAQKDIREHLTIVDAMSIAAFFFSKYQKLTKRTILLLKVYLTVMKWKAPKALKPKIEEAKKQLKEMEKVQALLLGLHIWKQ